ncbi:MAG: Zn-dependent hydrolase, partial [Clostridia bacterium]|nr:Zn-dependent hydrolase [Clostridia bacterium]
MLHSKININRLEKNLKDLSEVGKNDKGGIDRALGSEADQEARKWLMAYWDKNLELPVKTDAIANMWVERAGIEDIAPIVIGSHHDTVPNGGMYDGALGVLLATELVQILEENNVTTRHPIAIVSFTGEEPNPFNVSTLGSRVVSGRVGKEELLGIKNIEDGTTLQACIEKIGGDLEKIQDALIKPGDISAFIECHIEQGRRLVDANQAVASVNCIIGIYRENITIIGDANHAGTTVMRDRQDALLGACELNLAFEKMLKDLESDEVVGTIGYLSVFPNAANIIPGEVELVLEIRTCEPQIKEDIVRKLGIEGEKIMKNRGVKIIRKVNLDQREMPMDETVMRAINKGIEIIGEPVRELVSMAGHDAANMQRVTQSGMIFVQSIDGKSHC